MENQQIRVLRIRAYPDMYVRKKDPRLVAKNLRYSRSSFKSKLKFGEIWKEFGKTNKVSLISA
jgi:hypothetical protein